MSETENKIYRYMLTNNKIAVTEYDREDIEGYGYTVKHYYSLNNDKLIRFENMEIIKKGGSYIMWSINKENKNIFLNAIINEKTNRMMSLIKQAKTYKKEIETLESYKSN